MKFFIVLSFCTIHVFCDEYNSGGVIFGNSIGGGAGGEAYGGDSGGSKTIGKSYGGGIKAGSIGGHGPLKAAVAGHGYFPDAKKFSLSSPIYNRVPHVAPMSTGNGCPHGYMEYTGSCYLFSREKLTWYHASMKCEYMGGCLAVANSAHENSYFKLMSAKLSMQGGVWIGLNDILFPSTHKWNWGFSTKQCEWFDWGPKQPIFEGLGFRNCVGMWDGYNYRWKVENCNARHYYICEYNPKKICKCNSY